MVIKQFLPDSAVLLLATDQDYSAALPNISRARNNFPKKDEKMPLLLGLEE